MSCHSFFNLKIYFLLYIKKNLFELTICVLFRIWSGTKCANIRILTSLFFKTVLKLYSWKHWRIFIFNGRCNYVKTMKIVMNAHMCIVAFLWQMEVKVLFKNTGTGLKFAITNKGIRLSLKMLLICTDMCQLLNYIKLHHLLSATLDIFSLWLPAHIKYSTQK